MINIKNEVKAKLVQTAIRSEKACERTRGSILNQLNTNLNVKKESIESNKGVILRYNNTKPKGMTTMQQAFSNGLR